MKDNNKAYIYAEHLEYTRQKVCTLLRDTFLLKPDNQFGFKKKDDTNISIFTLQEMVAK